MNRLIIIGNGFDLAHGLKTSYSDFLEWYWGRIKTLPHNDNLLKIRGITCALYDQKFKSEKEILNLLIQEYGASSIVQFGATDYDYVSLGNKNETLLEYKNGLFGKLNKVSSLTNWVDIESLYYKELLNIHRNSIPNEKLSHFEILNNELIRIVRLFEEYLNEEVSKEIAKLRNDSYENLFQSKKLSFNEPMNDVLVQFNKMGQGVINAKKIDYKTTGYINFPIFTESLILNFNYTETVQLYSNPSDRIPIVSIHGKLNDVNNPINLGYGDEKDTTYQELENLNHREPLRFIKSFYYSNSSQYKRFIDFIESGPYQCQIMGHSCGLSDRTLLKTIFEHANCCSIKPYYYEYDQVNDWNEKDNYIELVQNISRHFDDKIEMRSKIVNKEYCQPLPQNSKK